MMEPVFVEGDDVIRRNSGWFFSNFCSLRQKRVGSLMWSAEGAERGRQRGRLLLWEFWGNSENVVFSGGAILNKPSTMRGGPPSVCRVKPPLLRDSGPPCCARFATSAKSRAAVTSEETKEPQERGGREGGGSTCREWGAERHRSVHLQISGS